ncbi:hypothetical protein NUW58_g4406 [Xylaria curta]|uniref:Uncharacterized protein n=1 Tax=Xylaria curta TaxID=42375 RepID=A0ACC1P6Z6_9PEZI|nr:hypothetical protein NUW58_g4406 [Xylaria curta]
MSVEAIGLVGSVLGIWQFAESLLPTHTVDASAYSIRAGVDGTDDHNGGSLNNAGGGIDLIKTYNNNGELIGSGGRGYIESGGRGTFSTEQTNSQQSIMTEFYATDDALCVAYITATMEDGTQWGWTGDWGYTCGLNWFPSGTHLQNSAGDDDITPRCTWIDGDHSNGIKAAVIGISWPSFYGKPEGDGKDKCGSSMRAWDEPGGTQILSASGIATRQLGPRQSQRSDDRLVVSHIPSHSAIEVCESETSWGPDFVSMAEGLYCNMETHEVLPLCSNSLTKGCFEVNGTTGSARVAVNGLKELMKPRKVVEWM